MFVRVDSLFYKTLSSKYCNKDEHQVCLNGAETSADVYNQNIFRREG